MQLDLQQKKVVITGGSRGIGLAIAQAFRDEGAVCLACGRNPDDLETAAKTAGCVTAVADVTTADGVAELVASVDETFGAAPDILVCNVGSGRSVPPGEETIEEWRRVFDVNLFSAARVIEAFSPGLQAGAVICCVSSIAGRLTIGAPVAYAASKSAVDAMVANLAPPLGRRGIRIFGVAPGNVMFPGSVWERLSSENPARVEQMLQDDVPLQRFGSPREVADMVVFLASSRGGFVTGSVHPVDGGQAKGR